MALTASPAATAPAVPSEIIDAIQTLQRPVVISHVVPDADALGSMFAMARAFGDEHCRPTCGLPIGSVSQRLRFLVDAAGPSVASAADFAAADGFVVVDTAKQARCNVGPDLKETDWVAGRPLVNIDHHDTNTQFGSTNWIVGGASSSAELVFYTLQAAGRPIDPTTASLLYAGMQTDTLGFTLPTTSASTLHAAAEVAVCGADIAQWGERLCRSQTPSEFNLLRVIYGNTKVLADGAMAYSTASFDEIHEAGCAAADIDDQINVPRSLDGVKLAMLFTEGHRGKTRINFRGSGNVTVVELAGEFQGGGHAQAAGAIVHGSFHEVVQRVLPRAVEHLKKFA